jgi:hypothetical protein
MTQQQKLEQLLSELKIPYSELESVSQPYASEEGMVDVTAWNVAIEVAEGIGLPGFVVSFYFDDDEAFLAHRIWKRD